MKLDEIENYLNDKLDYNKVLEDYKKEYIRLDNTSSHSLEEQYGLINLYDKIEKNNFYCTNLLDVMMLQFNKELYSKTPFPEAGGSYRNAFAVITNSDIKTTDPRLISKEIKLLEELYIELLLVKDEINRTCDYSLIKNYIDGVIALKCKVIEIHPFNDGNGRCSRALLNYMLRLISLPPIGIKNDDEKLEYTNAMDSAIRNKNYEDINIFYYNKINESVKKTNKVKKI